MAFFMYPTECNGDGWELHGEKCLKLVVNESGTSEQITMEDKYTFEEADEFCRAEGGKLATFHTLEDLELLFDFG